MQRREDSELSLRAPLTSAGAASLGPRGAGRALASPAPPAGALLLRASAARQREAKLRPSWRGRERERQREREKGLEEEASITSLQKARSECLACFTPGN
ncbi:hypothetical protein P7K49_035404 [Saguinus oedipus]|uniref:Uncharacterized protein n=1 Tax=Saguinus oedipus TaxID=9490 RepID=A0ABQ9TMI0_SAGOE|nr:hypothetical protein P7K49_035404 [Saguinus oedipus]